MSTPERITLSSLSRGGLSSLGWRTVSRWWILTDAFAHVHLDAAPESLLAVDAVAMAAVELGVRGEFPVGVEANLCEALAGGKGFGVGQHPAAEPLALVGWRHRKVLDQEVVGVRHHPNERDELAVGEQQVDRIPPHDLVVVLGCGRGLAADQG